ncbi:conjugal transfer protein TraB [Streptomyces melanogenes]|uniref:conjugal transfer protein TraB n=1 Tax=Streptomyces melanogenes TaxID=67326 RepID=UPI00167CFD97|nr:conjugal transfer protein TraB [Streptomyces melanogenes]GGP80396.1 conjugal transfer protein TraB [Streptomyces melanogenes]
MSDLVPRTSGAAAVPADSDNRYKAVQAKLDKLGKTMDDAAVELEALRRDIKANATHTQGVSGDIAHADLDPKFVTLTDDVAVALGGSAAAVKNLGATAQEIVTLTYQAKGTHSKLYRGLDEIRSNRREKTPKPGFFDR